MTSCKALLTATCSHPIWVARAICLTARRAHVTVRPSFCSVFVNGLCAQPDQRAGANRTGKQREIYCGYTRYLHAVNKPAFCTVVNKFDLYLPVRDCLDDLRGDCGFAVHGKDYHRLCRERNIIAINRRFITDAVQLKLCCVRAKQSIRAVICLSYHVAVSAEFARTSRSTSS